MKKKFKIGDEVYMAFQCNCYDNNPEIEMGVINNIIDGVYVFGSYLWTNNKMLFHTYEEAANYVLNSYKEYFSKYRSSELSVRHWKALLSVIDGMSNPSDTIRGIRHYASEVLKGYSEIDKLTGTVKLQFEAVKL